MKTKTASKLLIIVAAAFFAEQGLVSVYAGNFLINADGLVVTTTNTGQTSNNACAGYDNIVVSATSSFAFGGTNTVFGSVNAMAVGNNNRVAESHYGPSVDAYAFGGGNSITGASNAFVAGIGNRIGSSESFPNSSNIYVYGGGNQVDSQKNTYILGDNNYVANSSNVAVIGIGNTYTPSAGNSYIMGQNNFVTGNGSVVIGISNTFQAAAAVNSFILGSHVTLANSNGVILGANSADGAAVPVGAITIGAHAPAPVAGAAPVGIVSVGAAGRERQIINVAAGRVAANSTDAINGSELYATHQTLAAISATVAALASNTGNPAPVVDALLWNNTLNAYDAAHASAAASKITNVANGAVAATSLDAINGSQLHGATTSIIGILGTGTLNPDGTITGAAFATGATTVGQALANLHDNSNTLAAAALQWNPALNAYDASHNTGVAQRITNIANGTIAATSLDAINGSQLHAAATSVTNILGTGTLNPDGTITGATFITGGTTINQAFTNLYNLSATPDANALQWNPALNAYDASHGTTDAQRITNIANGSIAAASLDAINGSQLYATATSIVSILGTGSVNQNGAITNATFITGGTTINQAITNLYNTSTALATDALHWNPTRNAFDASHGTTVAQRITNVANGLIAATSLDAINGSQLHATAASITNILGTGTVNPDGAITNTTFITGGTTINQAITNIYNTSTALAADSLHWNPTLAAYDASHGTGIAQRITNVANGLVTADSLDATNGAQLYGTATSIAGILGTGSVNPDGTVIGGAFIINGGTCSNVSTALTTLDHTINNLLTGAAGLVQQDTATGNITIGAATSGTVLNIAGTTGDRRLTGVAAGSADNDAVNIAQLKTAGIITGTGPSNAIANVVTYDTADKSTITLGAPATATGRTRITNLADAALTAASTDAVNGSQLFNTNQRVTNLETVVAIITSGTSKLAGTPHFSTGNDDATIPATATGGNATAAGMGATAAGASSSALGMGALATAAHSNALGSLSETQATGGVALGNHALVAATAANSVAIGADSIATDPNTVSFGNDTLQRRLVNIADGIGPHDAVNMRQFTTFQNAVSDRFANVQNQVNQLGNRIDNVGAMSAAMNQVQPRLAVSQNGNRNQLALGVGGYRGHGAFAMGYGYTCPQGDRGVQASFALSDKGEVMAGAGAIFGW